jgi:hypothetical protein
MMRTITQSLLLVAVLAASMSTLDAVVQQRPTFVTHQQGTLVMKNADRHSGTLVYHNDDNFNLLVNGQEQSYPIADVALIDFGAGTPSAAELKQLPTSNNAPELERHMLVLRDGTVVHGKMYTIKENAITFDTQAGERRDFDLSTISRMYMSGPGGRQVFAAQLQSDQGDTAATAGQPPPSGAIVVDGSRAWTDAGITVRRGQRIGFSTTGEVSFRANERVGADGSATENRQGLPVPELGVGALIGRIGTGAPFAIGSNSQLKTMPAAGRLYLGINDTNTGDNAGAFTVTIVR